MFLMMSLLLPLFLLVLVFLSLLFIGCPASDRGMPPSLYGSHVGLDRFLRMENVSQVRRKEVGPELGGLRIIRVGNEER